ncbi:hypothetical protein LTR64_005473 [Lithohypha guttulata]|uniref:uncharacterized protein n=1 Tax=Lithohypha guttulata TaxID=1690604 RepID=UPI00315DC329
MDTEHLTPAAWLFNLLTPGILMVVLTPSLQPILDEHCRGKVLDIGPGSGFQLKRFKTAFEAGKIDEIYAVEPGTEMHDQLKGEAIKVFGGKAPRMYQILSCGAQPDALIPYMDKHGLLQNDEAEGLFDTIVCIRALCGIPDPRETANLFYRLLKPGGKIIFFEHVGNSGDRRRSGSRIAYLLQKVYMMLGYQFLASGCDLTRDTAGDLRTAAAADHGWDKVRVVDRNPEGCIPEVWGYMQKKSKRLA